MEIPHLPATTTPEEALARIRECGAVIIDALASRETMDRVERELDPYLDRTPHGDSDALGKRTRRTNAIIARSPTARGLINHPLPVGTARGLIDRSPTIHVSLTEIIALSPGSQPQAIHQDDLAYDGFEFAPDHHVQMSSLWAMSDYTEEMGATRVVPGTHTLGVGQHFEQSDTIPAEMERGSVMLYSAKVYHGSGENRSSRVRKALNINYAAGWLRQEENQYLSCPPEIARTLDEDLLRLMGYQCTTALGFVTDRLDPLSVLLERYRDAPAVYAWAPIETELNAMTKGEE